MAVHHPSDTGPETAGRRRRLWWIAGAGLLALLVVIMLVANVWASQRADSADVTATRSVTTPSPAPSRSPGPSPSPVPAETTTPAPSVPDPNAGVGVPSSEVAPPQVQEPVPLTDPAVAVPGVVFSISELEAVEGVARGPGEIAGPSLRFAVSVRNDTAATVSLTSTVVNFFFGAAQSPATELAAPGGVSFPDEVAAGQAAQGVFVFTVPADARDEVQIAVDYSAGVPIVLFEGAAPH
ncbi:hypothetical protein [Cryobacterium sp. TMS1-13-1]|uniref:hypothetical protein n=1 Tax=Cryobacterium sp. TMS1-13-1 TaxID=1259220 RepID=UPI001069A3C4|nr:hypothetical protein [Cryobacterium sp. TMS1-13-1]TFD24936.1 hypothetical protein E3T31_01415 [Cryobacterium sp. TMS1-13-1]